MNADDYINETNRHLCHKDNYKKRPNYPTLQHNETVKDFKTRISFQKTAEGLKMTVCYYHVIYEFHSESTLYSLPECQGTPCSKQAPYLKFKGQQEILHF